MTTAILIKKPEEWERPDEDGDKLADSFQVGMTLEVSTKGNHCRVYVPEDANIPFDCLEYVSGDSHPLFSSRNMTTPSWANSPIHEKISEAGLDTISETSVSGKSNAPTYSRPSGFQESEQDDCGTTHYAGCACHERGWVNKWKCAVEMAAIAQVERDAAVRVLESIEEIYIDGCDTYEDWKSMGNLARNFLYPENA